MPESQSFASELISRKSGGRWVLPINLDAVGHEGISYFKNWKPIEVPLLGTYIEPPKNTFDEVIQDFNKLIETTQDPLGKAQMSNKSQVITAVAVGVEAVPTLSADSPKLQAICYYLAGIAIIDDALEYPEEVGTETDGQTKAKILCQIFRNLWLGFYPTPEDIPKSVPEVYGALLFFHHAHKLTRSSIPHAFEEAETDCFIEGFEVFVNALTLSVKENYRSKYSLDFYRFVRVPDSHVIPMFQFALQIEGIRLKAEIKENLLYKFLLNTLGLETAIFNDIISLPKDIARDLEFNYVRLYMKSTGANLEEAVQHTRNLLDQQVMEIEQASIELLKEYDNDPQVIKMLEAYKNMFNGFCTFAFRTSRYGGNVALNPIKKELQSIKS